MKSLTIEKSFVPTVEVQVLIAIQMLKHALSAKVSATLSKSNKLHPVSFNSSKSSVTSAMD